MSWYTAGYGYDIVLEIDPSVYEVTTPDGDVGYAFEMNDRTRRALAGSLKRALDHPEAVEQFDAEPGYLRVRINPAEGYGAQTTSKELLSQVRDIKHKYNETEATKPDLDGIDVQHWFVGIYEPSKAQDPDAFLEKHAPDRPDEDEDADGPVLTVEPETNTRSNADRALAYEHILPFDAEMYETNGFEWTDRTIEYLQQTLTQGSWRHLPAPRITVYPDHIRVVHKEESINYSPAQLAARVSDALLSFNGNRPLYGEGGPGNNLERQPRLELDGHIYIAAHPPEDSDATEFIERRSLDDVDGEPEEPSDPDVAVNVEPDETSSRWRALNPFSGG